MAPSRTWLGRRKVQSPPTSPPRPPRSIDAFYSPAIAVPVAGECSPMGAEAEQSGEEPGAGGGAALVAPELPPANGSEIALDMAPPERVSWEFVGPKSLMMALLS